MLGGTPPAAAALEGLQVCRRHAQKRKPITRLFGAGSRSLSRWRETDRRARSPPDRASRRGQARYGGRVRSRTSCCSTIEVIRGTASDGQMSGGNLYPAPTLQVFPGETLIVHLENGLIGPDHPGLLQSAIHAEGSRPVPIYPEQMTSSPLNLHIHGAPRQSERQCRQRPAAHPAGMSNTYTYDIPRNMPQGAYWYHSHLHGLTAAQAYIGPCRPARDRTHGRQPAARHGEQHSHPEHGASIQFRLRSRRMVWRSSTTRTGRSS